MDAYQAAAPLHLQGCLHANRLGREQGADSFHRPAKLNAIRGLLSSHPTKMRAKLDRGDACDPFHAAHIAHVKSGTSN